LLNCRTKGEKKGKELIWSRVCDIRGSKVGGIEKATGGKRRKKKRVGHSYGSQKKNPLKKVMGGGGRGSCPNKEKSRHALKNQRRGD